MSIILDALKRGRARQAPRPHRDTAQTDAVLKTLGYGHFNPGTPLNRLKRVTGYVAVLVVIALLVWGAVIWATQALMPAATPEERVPPARSAPPPVQTPRTAQVIPESAPPPAEPVPPPPATAALKAAARNERRGPAAAAAAVPRGDRPPAPSQPDAGTIATISAGGDLFNRALMHQRLGDFENALVGYRQVLQRDDLNVEAHNNLGVLYRDKGLFDDASRHFQRAIAIDPHYARARNNLGVVYLAQKRFDAAATQFHAALSIDPRNVEALVNLSTVDREFQRRDEARTSLKRALEIDPRSAEAHYNLGLLEDEAGDAASALVHYRAFLAYGSAAHPALVGEVRKRIDALWPK